MFFCSRFLTRGSCASCGSCASRLNDSVTRLMRVEERGHCAVSTQCSDAGSA